MEKKAFRHFSMRAAMLLLVMMLTTVTAWAQSTETLGGYTFTIGTDGDGQYYKVDCEAALRALSSYSTSNNCSEKRFVQTADITLNASKALTTVAVTPLAGCRSRSHLQILIPHAQDYSVL